MSAPRNDGGSAFPTATTSVDNNGQPLRPYELEAMSGMSLRDWFAGQALAGVSAELIRIAAEDDISPEVAAENMVQGAFGVAGIAYSLADTMLAIRAKTGAA